jgi:molecular chaperone Hsp33
MNKPRLSLTDKEYLIARGGDRLTRFIADGGRIRGAYVQANLVVREMAASHGLGVFETYVLGQAYVAALLMASSFKEDERINLSVQSDGPAGGFSVDANAFGEVRGYLQNAPFRVPEGTEPTVAQIVGKGVLSVTRFDQNAPMTGSVEYSQASFAQSLAHYYDQSEQIATAFDLSLPFDREGRLEGAGGLMLQALPGYDEERWNVMAGRLYELPRIGENAGSSHDPEALLNFWFPEFEPQRLTHTRVEFFCPCSKAKFGRFLAGLPEQERADILKTGPLPLETRCHNCSSTYSFDEGELRALWAR